MLHHSQLLSRETFSPLLRVDLSHHRRLQRDPELENDILNVLRIKGILIKGMKVFLSVISEDPISARQRQTIAMNCLIVSKQGLYD